MPESDRPAVHVHLRRIDAQLADAGQRLARESLVQLDQVEVADRESGPKQGLAGGRNRTQPHHRGIHSGDGRGHDAGQRFQTQLSRPLGLYDQRRRGPVVDAAGVARRDGPALAEGRPQLRQGLYRSLAGMLVTIDHDRIAFPLCNRDRHDLLVVAALGDGGGRVALARQGEGVLFLAADAQLLGHVLARLAHRIRVMPGRQGRVDEAPAQRRVDEFARPALVGCLGLEHHVGRSGHRLHAAGDENVAVADGNRVGGRIDRLEPTAAQAVDGEPGDLHRQPGQQEGHASDVAVVLAGLVGATHDHVLDQRRVDTRTGDERADDRGSQIVGPDRRQRPAVPAEGRPECADDPGLANRSIELADHVGPIVRLCRVEPAPRRPTECRRPDDLRRLAGRSGLGRQLGQSLDDQRYVVGNDDKHDVALGVDVGRAMAASPGRHRINDLHDRHGRN